MDLKLYYERRKDYTERRQRAFEMSLAYEQKSRVRKLQDTFEIKKIVW